MYERDEFPPNEREGGLLLSMRAVMERVVVEVVVPSETVMLTVCVIGAGSSSVRREKVSEFKSA